MGTLRIILKDAIGQVRDPNLFEYSLRTALNQSHVWGNLNLFSNLSTGRYYYSVRKKDDGTPVSEGFEDLTTLNELPFEIELTGIELTIPQSQHGKQMVRNVLVIDSNRNILTVTPQLLSNESVIVLLQEEQKVKIRIS